MESQGSEGSVGAGGSSLSLRFGQQFISKGLYFPLLWGTQTQFLHVELNPLSVCTLLSDQAVQLWVSCGRRGTQTHLILRGTQTHCRTPNLPWEFEHSPFNASCSRGTWWTRLMLALGYLETRSCESGLRSHLVSCSSFHSQEESV